MPYFVCKQLVRINCLVAVNMWENKHIENLKQYIDFFSRESMLVNVIKFHVRRCTVTRMHV